MSSLKCLSTWSGKCERSTLLQLPGCVDSCWNAPSVKARFEMNDAGDMEIVRTEESMANPKDTAGAAKPRMGLIPVAAMEELARVMELGAKKYGPYNWRAQPIKNMVYANAALRHLYAWIGGQSVDPESGQSHLAHVASCMMIVLDAEATGACIEDREWLEVKKDA